MFRLRLWLKMRSMVINSLLNWNVSKKTSYIVEKKKFSGKICILNLENKKKIFARWKKITKDTGKIIIKSTFTWNNRAKFRKWITREEYWHFRSTIDTSRSRNRKIQFIIFFIFIFIELLEFRSVWNYFLNKVIVKFSI